MKVRAEMTIVKVYPENYMNHPHVELDNFVNEIVSVSKELYELIEGNPEYDKRASLERLSFLNYLTKNLKTLIEREN